MLLTIYSQNRISVSVLQACIDIVFVLMCCHYSGLWGGVLPPEEMWCSPHQSTGSDRVRLGVRGVVLPAHPSTTLHRLLSGPLTFATHLDEIQVIWWGVGAVMKVLFDLICSFIWIQNIRLTAILGICFFLATLGSVTSYSRTLFTYF